MTEFFKNNSIALRHCLLYEYLRKNSIEQSFTALRMTVGPGVIKKEQFQVWFDKFNQGVFDMEDDKKPITELRDDLRSDKSALCACILYESLKYKLAERGSPTHRLWPNSNILVYKIERNPSFFLYNHFCQVIGDDVMEYREFDFWFYRFLNGEFNLDYQINKDKKILELTDMPVDVMENIVEHLDIFDRTKLAKTSRSLQTFVEDQKLFHHTLRLTISNIMTNISFGTLVDIQYVKNYAGCDKIFENRVTNVKGVPYWKQAFLDLKSFLKNPKLHLDTLEVVFAVDNEHVFNDLEDTLEFTHYLNVKNLILREYSLDKLPNIISSLKPGYLTSIDIGIYFPKVDSMEGVFEMEQWKQAKCFTMTEPCFIWPLRNLYHFKKFYVGLNKLSLEDIREIKEVLFKSSEFEKCVLNTSNSKFICEQEFGKAVREDPHIYHYAIPNSFEYFEIKVGRWTLEIQRQKS